jgi:hypothetical protein
MPCRSETRVSRERGAAVGSRRRSPAMCLARWRLPLKGCGPRPSSMPTSARGAAPRSGRRASTTPRMARSRPLLLWRRLALYGEPAGLAHHTGQGWMLPSQGYTPHLDPMRAGRTRAEEQQASTRQQRERVLRAAPEVGRMRSHASRNGLPAHVGLPWEGAPTADVDGLSRLVDAGRPPRGGGAPAVPPHAGEIRARNRSSCLSRWRCPCPWSARQHSDR